MSGRRSRRGAWRGSRGQRAVRRTCRRAGGSGNSRQIMVWFGLALSHRAAYLVGSGVSQAGEQREESAADRGTGCVPEDDLVRVRRRLDLADIAHEALGGCVDGVEDHELSKTRTSCLLSDPCIQRTPCRRAHLLPRIVLCWTPSCIPW